MRPQRVFLGGALHSSGLLSLLKDFFILNRVRMSLVTSRLTDIPAVSMPGAFFGILLGSLRLRRRTRRAQRGQDGVRIRFEKAFTDAEGQAEQLRLPVVQALLYALSLSSRADKESACNQLMKVSIARATAFENFYLLRNFDAHRVRLWSSNRARLLACEPAIQTYDSTPKSLGERFTYSKHLAMSPPAPAHLRRAIFGTEKPISEVYLLERFGPFLRNEIGVKGYERLEDLVRRRFGTSEFGGVCNSADLQEKLIETVEARAKDGRPQSLIRLGDGESYLGDISSQRRSQWEHHWWGAPLADAARDRLIVDTMEALKTASMVGFPSVGFLVRALSFPARRESEQVQDLAEVFELIANNVRDEQVLLPGTFARKLVEAPAFRRQLADAGRVVVVSRFSEIVVQRSFPEIPEAKLHCFQVPPHFTSNGGTSPSGTLEAINAISHEVEGLCDREVVLLLDGGFAAKRLLGSVIRLGGVGWDLGHAIEKRTKSRSLN